MSTTTMDAVPEKKSLWARILEYSLELYEQMEPFIEKAINDWLNDLDKDGESLLAEMLEEFEERFDLSRFDSELDARLQHRWAPEFLRIHLERWDDRLISRLVDLLNYGERAREVVSGQLRMRIAHADGSHHHQSVVSLTLSDAKRVRGAVEKMLARMQAKKNEQDRLDEGKSPEPSGLSDQARSTILAAVIEEQVTAEDVLVEINDTEELAENPREALHAPGDRHRLANRTQEIVESDRRRGRGRVRGPTNVTQLVGRPSRYDDEPEFS